MAKALVAVVLCALLVASVAAETGRSLQGVQQDIKFDCDNAKKIGTVNKACDLLCSCAGSLDKSLSGKKKDDAVEGCKKTCGQCVDAAKTCKAGGPLPKECEEGQKNQYVKQCITTYLKSQSG